MQSQGRKEGAVERTRRKRPKREEGYRDKRAAYRDPSRDCSDTSSTYQNNFNVSNYVPPQQVLRMKLHASFPILYLPEYILRRFSSVDQNALPKDMSLKYRCFLEESRNKQKKQPNPDKVENQSIRKENYGGLKTKTELLEVLVRTIVVPLDASTISLVSHPKASTSTDFLKGAEMNTAPNSVETNSTIYRNATVGNCYTKPRIKRKFNEVSTYLHTLTDGVISTLVHQKKHSPNKKSVDYNHRCYNTNILSQGYKLSSGGYKWRPSSGPHSSVHKKRRISRNTNSIVSMSTVSECPNMRPGVEMTSINACASFARYSPEMKLLHEVIGDDGMREILLKCIVLIPIPVGNEENNFTNGNYFQLCGPPLNLMTLQVRPRGFLEDDSDKGSNKRKLGNTGNQALSSSKTDPFLCVPRHRMFYADTYTKEVGLPPRHLLNQSDTVTLELRLLETITNYNKTAGKKRWKRLRGKGQEICKQILKNHRKCDYHRMLERSCPLPTMEPSEVQSLQSLISQRSHTANVSSFFKSVMKSVFPIEFWGSAHNFCVVLNGIETFLSMRKKEKIAMKQIMKGIRILDIRWLFNQSNSGHTNKRPKTDHEAATRVFDSVMQWVYCHFLIPIVRSTFYCTDTEFTGDQLIYYRKPVWTKIRSIATEKLRGQFKRVERNKLEETLKQSSLGFSGLRILPKANGNIRPIALLCKQERSLHAFHNIKTGPSWQFRGTNQGLKEAFKVLSFEHRQNPTLFGAGVHGFHEVHKKLLGFVEKRKGCPSELYFASVDIHHCYDNINQSHLLGIIDNILSKEEYASQECTIIHPFDGTSRLMHKKEKSVGSPGNIVSFLDQAKHIASRQNHAVVVDQVRCHIANKAMLLSLLEEHLSRNLVVLKDQFAPQLLLQTSGIPQGSILSSMLCNYYYGDIEPHLLQGVFHDTSNDQNLLIRVIDDFILITSNKNTCKRFIEKMRQGSSHYGVQINEKKTKTSHEIDATGKSSRCTVKMNGRDYFQWCGLLINTANCEVQIDYSRFAATRALDTITINMVSNEGEKFALQLRNFVRPRCSPILFDSRINSPSTTMINFHQAIIMCAIKTVHYIVQSLDDGGPKKNEKFLFRCIKDVVLFAHNLIQSNLRKLGGEIGEDLPSDRNSIKTIFDVKDALWLGIHAFQAVYRHTTLPNFEQRASSLENYLKKLHASNYAVLKSVASKSLKSFDLKRFHV